MRPIASKKNGAAAPQPGPQLDRGHRAHPATGKAKKLDADDLRYLLLKLLAELEGLIRHIGRKSMHLDDFLSYQTAGKLPLYRVEKTAGEYDFLDR